MKACNLLSQECDGKPWLGGAKGTFKGNQQENIRDREKWGPGGKKRDSSSEFGKKQTILYLMRRENPRGENHGQVYYLGRRH